MPYKVAVEYWAKSSSSGVKVTEVIADESDQRPANKLESAVVALFSPTASALYDLLLLPA